MSVAAHIIAKHKPIKLALLYRTQFIISEKSLRCSLDEKNWSFVFGVSRIFSNTFQHIDSSLFQLESEMQWLGNQYSSVQPHYSFFINRWTWREALTYFRERLTLRSCWITIEALVVGISSTSSMKHINSLESCTM